MSRFKYYLSSKISRRVCLPTFKWSYDNQGELDALEDIFKAPDQQEPALKPALSCILAPALCAVYGAPKDGIMTVGPEHDLQPNPEKELACIQVHIESVDDDDDTRFFFDDDEEDDVFLEIPYSRPPSPSSPTSKGRPRSPELLYPPVPTLTAVKERLPVFFNYKYSTIFVSGYEAERQRLEKRAFGKHTAASLAERRSSYCRKRRETERKECIAIENEIDLAIQSKFLQLKMADDLEQEGTQQKIRRAKLWRRCAAMAEVLAKEHAEAFLWKQKFEEATGMVFGNKSFY